MEPTFIRPLELPVPLHAGRHVVRSANVGQLLVTKAALLPALTRLLAHAPGLFDVDDLVAQLHAARDLTAREIAELCLLLEQADVAVDLVATLAPLPRQDVLALMPDEFAYLFAACVAANWDFFVRSLAAFAAAGRLLRPAGTNSSPAPSTP